ncbi:J domain-containing protein [Halomonas sp. HNIBRBA4712]|uniref:J domain-containing protein n=1 Tax=Halomonas sp. HNIBRBA4712 TaxID=3373087 RepID=UPI003745DC9F
MPTARFSRFERMLVESHSQVDSAVLLLLAWVLCKRPELSPTQRLQRLARAGERFTHGHGLKCVLEIAGEDTRALQLAAEIVQSECPPARRPAVLHQAILLATDDGALSPANHYVLRFLADLLAFEPDALAAFFLELTGTALTPPEDISRHDYWLREDSAYRQAQAEKTQAEQRAREQRAREERQRQERENAESARRERAQAAPSDAYKSRRALAVLGLAPGASREEIRRAYRRLAQLHHPDRAYAKSEHHVALASKRFQRIKSAYDYLIKASL